MPEPSSPSDEPELEQVADGVYAYVQPPGGWCVNNAGLIVGGDTAIVVDTVATERRARRFRDQVDRVARRPPTLLVNTHHHGDHTFGNARFAPPATVVGHDRLRDEALTAGLGLRGLWPDVEWGDTPLVPPVLTFADRLTVHAGDLEVELAHHGPAHTTNDVVVRVPDRRVLFTGDIVMSGTTPFVLMGSVEGSLRTIEALRRYDPEVVVPGHGPVGGPELFDVNEAYLRRLREVARAGVRDGLTPLQAAREVGPGEFAGLAEPERLAANLHRAYAELDGRPPGAPLDIGAAFQDMVTFHGGLPASTA